MHVQYVKRVRDFGMYVLKSYVINFTYFVKPDSCIGPCVLIVEYCLCLLNTHKFSVIHSVIYQQMQYHFAYCMCICGYSNKKTWSLLFIEHFGGKGSRSL